LKCFDLQLLLPTEHPKADQSPFGFPITVNEDAGFTKNQLVEYLESKGIATRVLFGGNLTKQPAYIGKKFEKIGELMNSDTVMGNTFWIGVYPGLTQEMREYVVQSFAEFMKKR